MRLAGVNRQQNDLQNQFKLNSSYVYPTNGTTATSRELTRDEMVTRLV